MGPVSTKSLKLKLKLILPKTKENRIINVSNSTFFSVSNKEKKKVKAVQGTTTALIKQLLAEVSALLYLKMKFIGVGYRAFYVENYDNKLLLLKLGFSHFIYFKISDNLKTCCLKFTRLFIYGSTHEEVRNIAWLIRSCKKPEPYKGKGIRFVNENIALKEGKKV
jgi:large subunit ribosomal protein L6